MICRFFFCFLSCIAFCFSQAQETNVLKLRKRPHYTEENHLYVDSVTRLRSRVCFDKPNVIDEEHCYQLTLTLPDPARFRQMKQTDPGRDTTVVKGEFVFFSPWLWEEDNKTISGSLSLLSMTKTSVTVQMDLRITYRNGKQTCVYSGKRTFKLATEKKFGNLLLNPD